VAYKFHQVTFDVSQEPFVGLCVHVIVLSRKHEIVLNVSVSVYRLEVGDLLQMQWISQIEIEVW